MPLWSTWLVFRLASIKPLFLKNHSFLSPSGSVPIKEHAFPRSCPLAFTITAITSLQKKIFLSPYPSLPWVERFSIRLWLSLFIGRIPCLTFAENNICILSCRERSWHWPVKASGRIRSWNVEESSIKVSVCLEEVKGTIPHLCLNWGLENKPRNMCSPLSERMGEMRRHVTETMITASSMRANVVFMTA